MEVRPRRPPATQKYLICNADEGDPGAFMDRAVIESDPHRLLEGMAIAAYAIGATKAYVYIRAEYPLAIKRLKAAIAQAEAYGLLGDNILGSGFNLDIIIKMGAGAFVCGEETALIHSIEGKRGMPRPRPPFPAVSGLFGKPTIINNVETLANLPHVVDRGAEWFARHRHRDEQGHQGLRPLRQGPPHRPGRGRRWARRSARSSSTSAAASPTARPTRPCRSAARPAAASRTQHLDIDIDYESLKTVGAIMGSGGLVVMDEDTCMVDVAKFFMDFIQRESCGKCIPCREGTRRHAGDPAAASHGAGDASRGTDALERFQSVMHLQQPGRRRSATPASAAWARRRPTRCSARCRWFRDEYEAHIYERSCPAAACRELVDLRTSTRRSAKAAHPARRSARPRRSSARPRPRTTSSRTSASAAGAAWTPAGPKRL